MNELIGGIIFLAVALFIINRMSDGRVLDWIKDLFY